MIKRMVLMLWAKYCQLRGASLAQGARIYPSVKLQPAHITMGKNSLLYWNIDVLTGASGRLTIADNSHIAPYAYILLNNQTLSIGSNVAIGPRVSFFAYSNDIPADDKTYIVNSYKAENIVLENNILIGAHTVILPGAYIESNVVVGANSVVIGRLQSGYVYAGSPAKQIKSLYA